jgi:hypothetical protein
MVRTLDGMFFSAIAMWQHDFVAIAMWQHDFVATAISPLLERFNGWHFIERA